MLISSKQRMVKNGDSQTNGWGWWEASIVRFRQLQGLPGAHRPFRACISVVLGSERGSVLRSRNLVLWGRRNWGW
jgi:hypothetical protein